MAEAKRIYLFRPFLGHAPARHTWRHNCSTTVDDYAQSPFKRLSVYYRFKSADMLVVLCLWKLLYEMSPGLSIIIPYSLHPFAVRAVPVTIGDCWTSRDFDLRQKNKT